MDVHAAIAAHYARGDLLGAILAGLRAAGLDPEALRPEDLAPVDEFHIGGRQATLALAEMLAPPPGAALLDVGAGLGGPSRLFAAEHACRVTGIDLTPEFVEVARHLAERVGLGDRVDYRQGSAERLPFADATFDGVTMMHVGMNVADKPAAYGEVRRVLRPGGRFAVYDVLAGRGNAPRYPVPWAASPETSFLVGLETLQELLAAAGFVIERAQDRTAASRDFFDRMLRERAAAPPPLGIHLLLGEDAPIKVANMRRNLEEERIAPWIVLCR